MKYFTSPEDLKNWVEKEKNAEVAASKILQVIGNDQALSVKEACHNILNEENKKEDMKISSEQLFHILSIYGITENGSENMKTTSNASDKMSKQAQYRHPQGIEYNRETQNAYNNTPWRRDRDQMYGFIHRNPDMISFDSNPAHVYSGEALWRAYIMDKFYRDYKDENGRVVGGYINDRFQVFHDVAGNQMELANGERTRKPRPHQWSTERRLEEARGNKLEDVAPLKVASKNLSREDIRTAEKVLSDEDNFVDIEFEDSDYSEQVFNIFKDILDMKDAGVSEEDIICKTAEHYGEQISDITRLYTVAMRQRTLHKNLVYASKKKTEAAMSLQELMTIAPISARPVTIDPRNPNNFEVGSKTVQIPEFTAVKPTGRTLPRGEQVFVNSEPQNLVGVNGPSPFFIPLNPMEQQKIQSAEQYYNSVEEASQKTDIDESFDELMGEENASAQPADMNQVAHTSHQFPITEA